MFKRVTLFLLFITWISLSFAAYAGVNGTSCKVQQGEIALEKTPPLDTVNTKVNYLEYLTDDIEGAELIKTVVIDPYKKIHLIYLPKPDHYLILRIHRASNGDIINAKSTIVGKSYMVNMNMLYKESSEGWKL